MSIADGLLLPARLPMSKRNALKCFVLRLRHEELSDTDLGRTAEVGAWSPFQRKNSFLRPPLATQPWLRVLASRCSRVNASVSKEGSSHPGHLTLFAPVCHGQLNPRETPRVTHETAQLVSCLRHSQPACLLQLSDLLCINTNSKWTFFFLPCRKPFRIG